MRKTADEILAIDDTKTEEVYVEAWDTSVKIKGLTKRQQLDIRTASVIEGEVNEDRSQMLLWLEGVEEPKFTEDQMGPLFEKQAGAIDTVIKRILILSGMQEEALKVKEAAFRNGRGSEVPVQLSTFPSQDSGGVAVGDAPTD